MNEENKTSPNPSTLALRTLELNARSFLLKKRNLVGRLEKNLNKDPKLQSEIKKLGGLAKILTLQSEDPEIRGYAENFINYQNALNLDQFFESAKGTIVTAETLAETLLKGVSITTGIQTELTDCCEEIKTLLRLLDQKIDKNQKDLLEYINKEINRSIEETSESVVNKVVGESYYRFSATSTFLPTLILLFKEVDKPKYARRSQLKFKYKKVSDDITEKDIENLQKAFEELQNRDLFYGSVRVSYVSSDKSFKNTIFARKKEDVIPLLKFIYPLLGHSYEEKNLSYTEGRNRGVFNKRKKPLAGIKTFNLDYSSEIKMQLFRVVLLINGLEKPVLIWQA